MPLLAGSQLDAAVSYNARRGLDASTVERVQMVVGARVDGKLGPRTARAVFEWQGKVGLVQDGKLGPKTLAAIADAVERQPTGGPIVGESAPTEPRLQLGVWVDDRPQRRARPGLHRRSGLARALDLGDHGPPQHRGQRDDLAAALVGGAAHSASRADAAAQPLAGDHDLAAAQSRVARGPSLGSCLLYW